MLRVLASELREGDNQRGVTLYFDYHLRLSPSNQERPQREYGELTVATYEDCRLDLGYVRVLPCTGMSACFKSNDFILQERVGYFRLAA